MSSFARWLLGLPVLLLATGAGRCDFEHRAEGETDAGVVVTSDARSILDATSDAKAESCAGALFCSGFEDPGLGDWPATNLLGNGTLSTTTDKSYRGSRSLQAQVFSSNDRANVIYTFPTPFRSGTLWVRGWVFVPSGYSLLSAAGAMHLFELTYPNHFLSARFSPQQASIYGANDVDEPLSISEFEDVVLGDAWHCFEWKVVLGANGSSSLFIDSALVVESGMKNLTIQGEGFLDVHIGQTINDAAPNSPIYLDEVVIAQTRVNCALDSP